ncbi:MAG: T9SS type A sorting domain-containing protein, partial [Ignavibacteria bacterium]|nr:T9SS type A sorting domain-containing protein [Ignavibacteria bacterium]
EKKGLLKAPNHLAGEQIALKMNLLGSKDSILTPGLANLLYDDGDVNNALNGFTIGEIANLVDSLLTFRGRPLASMNSETVLPSTADSVLTRINRAFRYHPSFSDTILDKLDTLKYLDTTQLIAGGLRIGAGNPISVAPYLRFNPNPLAKNEIDFPSLNIPNEFSLYQNYPNPFNPVTTISFDLPVRSTVTMKVYNILGQVVATLSNNEILEEGTHELQFDASPFASGVYFARISTQSSKHSFEDFKKMILIK